MQAISNTNTSTFVPPSIRKNPYNNCYDVSFPIDSQYYNKIKPIRRTLSWPNLGLFVQVLPIQSLHRWNDAGSSWCGPPLGIKCKVTSLICSVWPKSRYNYDNSSRRFAYPIRLQKGWHKCIGSIADLVHAVGNVSQTSSSLCSPPTSHGTTPAPRTRTRYPYSLPTLRSLGQPTSTHIIASGA